MRCTLPGRDQEVLAGGISDGSGLVAKLLVARFSLKSTPPPSINPTKLRPCLFLRTFLFTTTRFIFLLHPTLSFFFPFFSYSTPRPGVSRNFALCVASARCALRVEVVVDASG